MYFLILIASKAHPESPELNFFEGLFKTTRYGNNIKGSRESIVIGHNSGLKRSFRIAIYLSTSACQVVK